MKESLKEFLARQLNDHKESQRGVRQPTYFTWNENHIADAIDVASAFLFMVIPEKFAVTKKYTLETEDCIVSFCEDCDKFLGLVDLEINGEGCIDLDEEDTESNSLLSMLDIGCTGGSDDESKTSYSYKRLDSSTCLIKFSDVLPKGTVITYSCAEQPDNIESGAYDEYLPLIAEYAAAWLFRADSESKSSLDRAQLHLAQFQFLAQMVLQIEFSLAELDYSFGHKKSTNVARTNS